MRIVTRPPHFIHHGAPYTFEEFLTSIVARHTVFVRDFVGIQVASRILANPFRLLEEDWKLLCQAVLKPSQGYPIPLPHRLEPYILAILNAADDQPPPAPEPEPEPEPVLEDFTPPLDPFATDDIAEAGSIAPDTRMLGCPHCGGENTVRGKAPKNRCKHCGGFFASDGAKLETFFFRCSECGTNGAIETPKDLRREGVETHVTCGQCKASFAFPFPSDSGSVG